MPILPHLSAQIQDFLADAKAALDRGLLKAADLAGILLEKAQIAVDRLGKRRAALIAMLGGVAIILLICAGALASKNKTQARGASPYSAGYSANAELVLQGFIPPDEVFLPDEPDFVPGVMLEREQRSVWTAKDAEPLWQDPLKDGEEPWRNRIEKAIDEIMESVP